MPITIEILTAFFGWCFLVNSAILGITTVCLYPGRGWIPRFHAKLFSLPEDIVKANHFKFLADYKLFTLVFSLVPYISLKLLSFDPPIG